MSKVADANPSVQNISALAAIQRGMNPAAASPAKHAAKTAEHNRIHLRLEDTESTNGPQRPFKNHGR